MAAGQKTHTEVPPKAHFPPFDRETFASQLFWFAIAFVLLYVLDLAAGDPARRRDHGRAAPERRR